VNRVDQFGDGLDGLTAQRIKNRSGDPAIGKPESFELYGFSAVTGWILSSGMKSVG
jgi:hypothetical protein